MGRAELGVEMKWPRCREPGGKRGRKYHVNEQIEMLVSCCFSHLGEGRTAYMGLWPLGSPNRRFSIHLLFYLPLGILRQQGAFELVFF